MSNEIKISDFQSKIKDVAKDIDKRYGDKSKSINTEAEFAMLQVLLNGDKYKSELSKENDDVKKIFGFTASVDKTEAQTVTTPQEQDKKKDAYTQVYEAFQKARGYDEESGKYAKTLKDAYKEVEDEFTNKKKYSKEERKEFKKALKQLNYDRKKGVLLQEAAFEARRSTLAVDDQGNVVNPDALKYTSLKDIRRAEIDALTTKDGKVDKKAKRALRQHNGTWFRRAANWLSGNDSAGKIDDKSVRSANRAANIRLNKRFSKEELTKKFGEDFVNALIDYNLIKADPNAENKYDVTELSKLVGSALGADNTYNDHDVDVEAENQRIQTVLATRVFDTIKAKEIRNGKTENDAERTAMLAPKPSLDKSKTRDLVELLGYYDDTAHGRLIRTYQKGMQGLAAGAFIGAVSSIPNTYKLDMDQKQTQLITYDENMTEEALIEIIKQGGIVDFVDASNGILQQQHQFLKLENVWKAIGLGAAVGAATGAAAGVLQGLLSKGREKEAVGLLLECEDNNTTPARILVKIDSIQNMSDEDKQKLKQIVVLGYQTEMVTNPETGKTYERFKLDENCEPIWDYCKFEKAYNEFRGNQIFNSAELRAAALKAQNRLDDVVKEDCKTTTNNGCYEIETKEEVNKTPDKADDVATIHHAAKYGWTNLGRLYDCFNDMSDKQAWRAMQVIQAIDPEKVGGKYREDQIRAIVTKAFVNDGNGKPNWNYINNELTKEFNFIKLDTLKAVLNADYAGTEVTSADRKIRKGQDGYDKVNVVVAPITLYNADGTEACTRTKDPNRDTTKYDKGNGTANNKVRVSTHYTQAGSETKVKKYRGKSGDTYTAWYSSDREADAASKDQFKNKRRCDK